MLMAVQKKIIYQLTNVHECNYDKFVEKGQTICVSEKWSAKLELAVIVILLL